MQQNFFCCPNKKFCSSDQNMIDIAKCFVGTTKEFCCINTNKIVLLIWKKYFLSLAAQIRSKQFEYQGVPSNSFYASYWILCYIIRWWLNIDDWFQYRCLQVQFNKHVVLFMPNWWASINVFKHRYNWNLDIKLHLTIINPFLKENHSFKNAYLVMFQYIYIYIYIYIYALPI